MEGLGDFINRKNTEHDELKKQSEEETKEPEKKDDLGDFLQRHGK